MKKVIVVIPMYKEQLDERDRVALRQLRKVLGRYPRAFLLPESLQPQYGALGSGTRIERFRDDYFRGTLGYSSLMLSDEFYARFADYEYVLIYQTDAFVFRDDLARFCAMGYDYIGAPVSRMDAAWHVLGITVGNGGFSLRRVAACRRVLAAYRKAWEQHPFHDVFQCFEDLFFSWCGTQKELAFRVPDARTALSFAVQGNVSHAYQKMARGWRPFGCHGWDKLCFEPLTHLVERESGVTFPAFTEVQRQAFRTRFLQNHRYRAGVNILPILGMARRGNLEALCARLQSALAQHPAGDAAWAGKAEVFGFLWRRLRMEERGGAPAASALRCLEEALYRSCRAGGVPTNVMEVLFSMLPQLPEGVASADRVRTVVSDLKWAAWERAAHYAAPYAGPRRKRVIVAAWCEDDADVLESFVRHTLSFADAILVNVHASGDESRTMLQQLQAEGCAVDALDQAMTFPDFCALVRGAADADFILGLPVRGFLLPARGSTVRGTLEALDAAQTYDVPVRLYAPLHEDRFQDKFLLARALVRGDRLAPGTVIFGRGKGEKAPQPAPLELAIFTQKEHLKAPENVDIAPLVEPQMNRL